MKTNLKEFTSIDELLDVTEELLEASKEIILGHGFNEGNLDLMLDTVEISTKSLLKLQQAINKAEGNN